MSNEILDLLGALDRAKVYDDDFVLETYEVDRHVVEVGEADGYVDYRADTMTITLTLRVVTDLTVSDKVNEVLSFLITDDRPL